MEIGSFIELQFEKGKEYYKGDKDIARLNSGRAAIYHAFRVTNCSCIWIPYYQCDTVRNFLIKHNVVIKFYHIDNNFEPTDIKQSINEAVLIVNYFGIMSFERMKRVSSKYLNVIIDNSQAFFSTPIKDCLNVYSCRKFFGVPDGSYVIGKNADKLCDEYKQGYSSDTALFLLQRIEYGCEGIAYESRKINENRIDNEDVKQMSKLTRTILDGIDYNFVKKVRRENFKFISDNLNGLNLIGPIEISKDSIPMVYPFVCENENTFNLLLKNKHFQGRWWNYILNESSEKDFEHFLSKNLIPITIDQRYNSHNLAQICKIIKNGEK